MKINLHYVWNWAIQIPCLRIPRVLNCEKYERFTGRTMYNDDVEEMKVRLIFLPSRQMNSW